MEKQKHNLIDFATIRGDFNKHTYVIKNSKILASYNYSNSKYRTGYESFNTRKEVESYITKALTHELITFSISSPDRESCTIFLE